MLRSLFAPLYYLARHTTWLFPALLLLGLPATLSVAFPVSALPTGVHFVLGGVLLVLPAALLVHQLSCLADGRRAASAELSAMLARRWVPLLFLACAMAVARWIPLLAPGAAPAFALRLMAALLLIRMAFLLPLVVLEDRDLVASLQGAWSVGRRRWLRMLVVATLYSAAYLGLARALGAWGNAPAAAILLAGTGLLLGLFTMTLTLEFRDAMPAHGATSPPPLVAYPPAPEESPAEDGDAPQAIAGLEEFGGLAGTEDETPCR